MLSLTGVYYFAVPAAALFTLALACQVRADGGARIGWMVAAGVGYGLAALARTMVAGLVPAAAAVAVVAALWPGPRPGAAVGGDGGRRAAGAVVALAWYAGNSEAGARLPRGRPGGHRQRRRGPGLGHPGHA